ncbi:hypothetical protein HZS55_05830 [Halosimplex rubrum]|uniref:DUF7964 domain-containing protein n=1 Tax=Halosimplex rubrum TaxID=869889 RepID=A0A7D5TKR0_9EURY|nr:hypothetical protein [Halosimplex rubrum]QLH76852.1 hypothetical protein HZS55_05830 [Halosimplex rubrum]
MLLGLRRISMTGIVDSLPDRPLNMKDYEALDESSAPIQALPVSWFDEELIYSLAVFLTRGEEPTSVIVAFDEANEAWVVVDRPDPDRGFDELGELLYPWFEETYEEIPDELAIVPPDYDRFDEFA